MCNFNFVITSMMPSLSPILKQHVLAASVNALKLLNNVLDLKILHDQLHKMH